MQYADVNGERSKPTRGLRGICLGCGEIMVSKCGDYNIHHWAHLSKKRCDSWWEAETIWHREWKEMFPEQFREKLFYDESNNEYHRADIYTKSDVTIEFQNSSISYAELNSREVFYKKLIWVVNGENFKRFSVCNAIPNPESPELNQYEIHGDINIIITRLSEKFYPKSLKDKLNFEHEELSILTVNGSFYSIRWKNPKKAYLNASSPVFIDLGGDVLYWLRKRHQSSNIFYYVKIVYKSAFVQRYSL